jgi:hypothetical protein
VMLARVRWVMLARVGLGSYLRRLKFNRCRL